MTLLDKILLPGWATVTPSVSLPPPRTGMRNFKIKRGRLGKRHKNIAEWLGKYLIKIAGQQKKAPAKGFLSESGKKQR
jgi:hypothetical protein